MKFEMPKRLPDDGPITFTRLGDEHFVASVTTKGLREELHMSRYNAARLFAMIGLFLEIELPDELGTARDFGAEGTYSFDRPLLPQELEAMRGAAAEYGCSIEPIGDDNGK